MNQCPYRDNVMCSHYIRCKKESVPDCEYYYKDMPITEIGKTPRELGAWAVVCSKCGADKEVYLETMHEECWHGH